MRLSTMEWKRATRIYEPYGVFGEKKSSPLTKNPRKDCWVLKYSRLRDIIFYIDMNGV